MPNTPASPPPTLFCLHFLGGSAREWEGVIRHLDSRLLSVPLDLPGFGDAADISCTFLDEMVEFIVHRIAAMAPSRWWIAGHSMGAKVALAIARRAEDGDRSLVGLECLVLLAGSPPSPEPMSDGKRRDMIAWISGNEDIRLRETGRFIDQNTGTPLSSSAKEEAVADVLRANPRAWIDWLEVGSRENWCRRIGVLRTPALVLSGSEDTDLGAQAQTCLMLPHLANARHVEIKGSGHLLPIENAETVADLICEVLTSRILPTSRGAWVPQSYNSLITGPRVNTRLRAALYARMTGDLRVYQPIVLDAVELSILRALIDRILPHEAGSSLDIGAQIETRLAAGTGDGWRFAELPPDAVAYTTALRIVDGSARTTHDVGFVALADEVKDALIDALSTAQSAMVGELLDGAQMAKWFEDLRSEAVRIYLAHPAALACLGFSGIGAGGDAVSDMAGFSELGVDSRDLWEPAAEVEIAR